jgi:hypothetical protein
MLIVNLLHNSSPYVSILILFTCNDFNDAIDSILSPAVDVINELF